MINIIWAPPRQGKTYYCTNEVVGLLKEGKRRIFTNWPVIVQTPKGPLSSRVWIPALAHENILESDIYIDEAYMDYNSREYKKFEKDTHTFFATNGHNDNEITLIAQNPARIDVVIREMCNGFFLVKKITWPFVIWTIYARLANLIRKEKYNPARPNPLMFIVYNFLTEKDMASRNPEAAYSTQRLWFNHDTARAYDTHYWKTDDDKPYEGKTWQEKLELNLNQPPVLAAAITTLETPIIAHDVRDILPDFTESQVRNIEEIAAVFKPTWKECLQAWFADKFLEDKEDMPEDLWIPGPPVAPSVTGWGTIP